eukprot:6445036-Alexandrium_andersonii.AAC.1
MALPRPGGPGPGPGWVWGWGPGRSGGRLGARPAAAAAGENLPFGSRGLADPAPRSRADRF